jgi:hypothetical protein
MAKPISCLLGIHRYRKVINEEGEPIKACVKCGNPWPGYHPPGSGAGVG